MIGILYQQRLSSYCHHNVIKWKHFPRYWSFVRGIHRSSVNSPHKGQWRGALVLTLICARINGWVNNREAGDLRRHRAHYDVIVLQQGPVWLLCLQNSFSGRNQVLQLPVIHHSPDILWYTKLRYIHKHNADYQCEQCPLWEWLHCRIHW